MRIAAILFFLLACTSLRAADLTPQETLAIGKRIFANECAQKKEKLVWWNQGEEFASLGIGHCIWYPAGKQGPFEETFPLLLRFFKQQQIPLPSWLETVTHCPWHTREEFMEDRNRAKHQELQELLLSTLSVQTHFLYARFQTALTKILDSLDTEERLQIEQRVRQLEASPEGKFALIDYFNFKGDGLSVQESYQGKRWGLKQVLQNMPEQTAHPLHAFKEAAKKILTLRVHNAPAERHEERWLPGWIARIENYTDRE